MKKVLMISFLALAAMSCNTTNEEATTEESAVSHEGHDHGDEMAEASYACPMECEDEKTYDEAGRCPVCKMDLQEVAQVIE